MCQGAEPWPTASSFSFMPFGPGCKRARQRRDKFAQIEHAPRIRLEIAQEGSVDPRFPKFGKCAFNVDCDGFRKLAMRLGPAVCHRLFLLLAQDLWRPWTVREHVGAALVESSLPSPGSLHISPPRPVCRHNRQVWSHQGGGSESERTLLGCVGLTTAVVV